MGSVARSAVRNTTPARQGLPIVTQPGPHVMPPMRPLTVGGSLLMLAIALGGCADNAYYQSRSMPTSSEESFGFGERLFWRGDKEVYELPARPPAREQNEDETHRSRVDCQPPGQHFLPVTIASIHDEKPGHIQAPVSGPIGGYDDRPRIPADRTPGKASSLVAWEEVHQVGAREPLPQQGIGGYDDRQQSQRASGSQNMPATKISALGEPEGWCAPVKP